MLELSLLSYIPCYKVSQFILVKWCKGCGTVIVFSLCVLCQTFFQLSNMPLEYVFFTHLHRTTIGVNYKQEH